MGLRRNCISSHSEPILPAKGLVLGALFGVYALDMIHRLIMALLLEPVGESLQLGDAALGLMMTAYAVCYGFSSPVVAFVADRVNRRNLLAITLFFWSLCSIATGLAVGFWSLLLSRIGLGLLSAGGMPASTSLLVDYYPLSKRASAIGVLTSGGSVGSLLAFLVWGAIAAAFGWRWAFISAGVLGCIYAPWFFFVVKEPPRGHSDEGAVVQSEINGFYPTLRYLWRIKSFRYLLLGVAFASTAMMGAGQWNAAFLIRFHGFSLMQVGITLAALIGLLSTISIIGAGFIADRLGVNDKRWYLWVPALGMIGVFPASLLAYSSDSVAGVIFGLGTLGLLAPAFGGIGASVAQSLAPVPMRSTAGGLFTSVMTLAGMGIGPQITGILSDSLIPLYGDQSLRIGQMIVASCAVPSALCFAIAAIYYRADLDRAAE